MKADELQEAAALYEIGHERITSGTKHPGKVEGQTKRGGGEGSEERRVRARPSEQPPAKSGPPEAERRPRAARSSGGKDRHSKVNTAKGPRDRRVRLSVPTAVQFYDVQDRLGYDQPSKAVEWLIKHAKAAIDELAQLPPVRQAGDAPPEQQQQQHQQQPPETQTSSVAAFSAGLPGVLAIPSLQDPSHSTSFGIYDRHGQPRMVSPGVAPFAHGAVQGMELPHGGPSYGQAPVDSSFPHREPGIAGHETHMFRTVSDVAGASSARVESRAKARERARERAKEKHHTGLERDAPPGRAGSYVASSGAHPYANLPSQVSSALQHPFQAAFHASGVNQRQPAYHHVPSFNFPEPFLSTAFGYPPQSYAPPEPSPSSLPSVSHYFVENPPGAMGARYPTSGASTPNPNFPSFAPGPPAASSLRPGASSFSSLLNEPQYSGFPSQGYYQMATPYPSQSRPPSSSLLGQSSSSRQPQQAGTAYPPPPSHLVRPGQDRQIPLHSTTPHSLDPNFYNPQIPNRLQGFEELEEEFKP